MKEIKKSNSQIRYLYDEREGVVIAFIKGCKYNLLDILCKNAEKKNLNHITSLLYLFGPSEIYLEDTYKGVACCSKEDKFDLETGMENARDRALNKLYKDWNKNLSNLIKTNNQLIAIYESVYRYPQSEIKP